MDNSLNRRNVVLLYYLTILHLFVIIFLFKFSTQSMDIMEKCGIQRTIAINH